MIVVVVVERDVGVVALNETSGRRVVVIRGQREAGVFAQVVDGLHQALAEGGFADDQARGRDPEARRRRSRPPMRCCD